MILRARDGTPTQLTVLVTQGSSFIISAEFSARATCLPREHLSMSTGIFGCHVDGDGVGSGRTVLGAGTECVDTLSLHSQSS